MCITSKRCKYCEGSGIDEELKYMGWITKCVDCRGTGFLHYEEGGKLYYKELDKRLALLEKNIDWDEVELLEKLHKL